MYLTIIKKDLQSDCKKEADSRLRFMDFVRFHKRYIYLLGTKKFEEHYQIVSIIKQRQHFCSQPLF
jgi:hypothetical protein